MIETFLAAICFAVVHAVVARLKGVHELFRGGMQSVAGGISMAYVFVHLLPALGDGQNLLRTTGVLPYLEHHVYLLAFGGVLLFYAAEVWGSRPVRELTGWTPAFALRLGAFALVNFLVGYALGSQDDPEIRPIVLFTSALGVHFVVNDHAMRESFADIYDRQGRWILATAPLLGWGVGLWMDIPAEAVAMVVAFFAGGVLTNIIRREFPQTPTPRNFLYFAGGGVGYSILLLL